MERLTSYKNECKREMICNHEECFVDEEHCPHVNEDICPCLQEVLEKLAEYEDLEEQGKLLKLDFKYQRIMIGQEIFVVEDGAVKSKKICHINEWWNDYHGFQGEYAAIPSKGFGSWEFKYEDFDKTVFLIREEAESALKELERGKGE